MHWSGWPKVGASATTIGALIVSITAVTGLYFTNQSLRATNNQFALSEQTAITDRFRLATEELSSDKISTRLSGVYLLERLAKDSPPDHPMIFSVLAAFLRTHTSRADCAEPFVSTVTPVDVAATLTVIGRRNTAHDDPVRADGFANAGTGLDITGTCLAGAHLDGTNFTNTNFESANLGWVSLVNANLTNTDFSAAQMSDAQLNGADLTNTGLTFAHLVSASLHRANLTGARMSGTDLTTATLTEANLSSTTIWGATLRGAHLAGANLTNASIQDADLTDADLTGANLTDVFYDNRTKWPQGFTPPPSRPLRR
ncbi:pentapeptide repeat-containing protein [Nocardia sp. NPDC004722]